jgi:hypothetical protein
VEEGTIAAGPLTNGRFLSAKSKKVVRAHSTDTPATFGARKATRNAQFFARRSHFQTVLEFPRLTTPISAFFNLLLRNHAALGERGSQKGENREQPRNDDGNSTSQGEPDGL